METVPVIKKVLIIILIFTFGVNAQNDDNYFKLYKEGQQIKKTNVYLKVNENFKQSLVSNKETFIYKNKFVFMNTGQKCQQDKEVVFSKVEDLYEIEKRVLDKHISNIEREHGFKPVYPLNHIVLKILFIKDNNCFVYEWKRQ